MHHFHHFGNSSSSFFTSALIPFLNLVIVAASTYILWLANKTARQNNEIQIRPLLDLQVQSHVVGPNHAYDFVLKNVGKGPAYNIDIATIRSPEGYLYTPFLQDKVNATLDVGASEQLRFWVNTPQNATEAYERITGFQRMVQRLFIGGNEAGRTTEGGRKTGGVFLVHYEGVNGQTYYTIFRFYPSLRIVLDAGVISQFVAAGDGTCDLESAQKICLEKPLAKHVAERASDEMRDSSRNDTRNHVR